MITAVLSDKQVEHSCVLYIDNVSSILVVSSQNLGWLSTYLSVNHYYIVSSHSHTFNGSCVRSLRTHLHQFKTSEVIYFNFVVVLKPVVRHLRQERSRCLQNHAHDIQDDDAEQ